MKQNALLELINSLSISEKRYISIQMMQSTDMLKSYQLLYILMTKEHILDDKILKEKLKENNIKLPLTAVKSYLYNVLLKVLADFYQKENAELQVIEDIKKIKVLYKKGLTTAAYDLIQKLKKYITRVACFENYLITLVNMEMEIVAKQSVWGAENYERLKMIAEKWTYALAASAEKKEYLLLNYYYTNHVLTNLNGEHAVTKQSLETFLQESLLLQKSIEDVKQSQARQICVQTLVNIYLILNQKDKILPLVEEQLKCLSQLSNKNMAYFDQHYLLFKALQLHLLLEENKIDTYITNYQNYAKKVEKYNNAFIQAKFISVFYAALLTAKLEHYSVDKLLVWGKIYKKIKKNIDFISPSVFFALCMSAATILFREKKYNLATDFINLAFDSKYLTPKQPQYFAFCVIYIVTQYEMKQFKYLKNKIRNIDRILGYNANYTREQKMIIKQLEKLVQISLQDINRNRKKRLLQKVFNDLDAFLAKIELQVMQNICKPFDFRKWVGTKILAD